MNRVDWSKAPSDAQFFSMGRFRKHENGMEFYHDGASWELAPFDRLDLHKSKKDFEMRPEQNPLTRAEQLDAVVRNYGEWEGGYATAYLSHADSTKVVFTDGIVKSPQAHQFIRAEVEARKAELQNKPDPLKLPDEANFYAQNESGAWDWFADKPEPDENDGCWAHSGAGGSARRKGEVIGDWRNTLEMRPNSTELLRELFEADANNHTPEIELMNNQSATDICDGGKWDGEGFPTVGVECECFDGEDWHLGVSVGPYLDGWVCVLSALNLSFIGGVGEFRPIKPEVSDALADTDVDTIEMTDAHDKLLREGHDIEPICEPSDFEDEAFAELEQKLDAQKTMAERYPAYFKDVSSLQELDVYAVHKLFGIEDQSGAIQHASKKLLLSGVRTGGKSKYQDVKEARDTLNRWLELNGDE